jgi:hypothetical protein
VVMVWRVATDVVLHSSINHPQGRATELRRLSKDVAAACRAIRFHGDSNIYM